MTARDPAEEHRASTPLELFLDLTFVVAIAQAGSAFHHGLVDGHASEVVPAFPLAFFAIWWAWMNFTWFASAYDTDDALYRVAVFVQMAGVLILAAGIPRAVESEDFGIGTLGYVVMRLAMVGQWLRAAASHPESRPCALRYAMGISVAQVGWVTLAVFAASSTVPVFFVLAGFELAIPWWAERTARTSWHPQHIAERYGLFTIIVLGESVLAATIGVQAALDANESVADLLPVIVGGIVLVCAMWWIYFDMPGDKAIGRAREVFGEEPLLAFVWGYGHYAVFASAALVGAGLAVWVDQALGHSALTDLEAGLALTVPAALYAVSVWLVNYRAKPPTALHRYGVPVYATLVLAASASPEPVLVAGLLSAGLIAVAVATGHGSIDGAEL